MFNSFYLNRTFQFFLPFWLEYDHNKSNNEVSKTCPANSRFCPAGSNFSGNTAFLTIFGGRTPVGFIEELIEMCPAVETGLVDDLTHGK